MDIENYAETLSKSDFSSYMTGRISSLLEEKGLKGWKYFASSNYFQIYNPLWSTSSDEGVIHFELFCWNKNEFPPRAIEVALHTHELEKRIERTDELKKMERLAIISLISKYRNNKFQISYDQGEAGFEESMDIVFDALAILIDEHSDKVSEEWMKTDRG